MDTENTYKIITELREELAELHTQLEEANDTLEAIRTGGIDALVVHGEKGHQLFTLKTADQTYRIIIENMMEGAVTLNKEGLILYCNAQFAAMTGREWSASIGLPMEEFIAPADMEIYRTLFNKARQTDHNGELCLIRKKELIPVKLSFNTLGLEAGNFLSVIVTDLTDQKEAETMLRKKNEQLADSNRALEASNRDLQQFASIASHDLQEPLRKIQVYSEILRSRQTDLNTDSLKYVDKIIDSSSRMRALITDILDYSGLSGANDFTEQVDLNELMKELRSDFELSIIDKNARLKIAALPSIEINKGQMRQVFQNIVNNALKFSKTGQDPIITINSKNISEKSFHAAENENGPYCLISIRDNGIGFEEKYADHIFGLFERLNTKDKYEGTGIGLSIAKKVIEKHRGLITAVSKNRDGAEFRIILPLCQASIAGLP